MNRLASIASLGFLSTAPVVALSCDFFSCSTNPYSYSDADTNTNYSSAEADSLIAFRFK
ncbi:hypothetical protein [Nostoc sp. DSM 114161]|jgi:hypothetical protein|uniref:hypothetical protein n=1 Tax=Nostoc sp. DSM 114161 TaxID=3440143 RepID=UPI0040461B14